MKYKLIIIFLALSTFSRLAYSQEHKVDWSLAVNHSNEEKLTKIIPLENNGVVVVLKKDKSTVRIDYYNSDKTFLETRYVVAKGKILKVNRVGASLYIFYSIYDSQHKLNKLFAKEITKETPKDILLEESLLLKNYHNNFKISVSPNYKKVFVLTEKPFKERAKEGIVLSVFDELLKKERTKFYLMSKIDSKKRKVNVPLVNNKGEVYIIKRDKGKSKSNYYIMTYTKIGKVNFSEFKLNYKPILDLRYSLDNKENLILGGTFSSPNSRKSEGVFIAKYNATCSQIYRNEYGFRLETMLEFTSKKEIKKEGLGLSNFRTKKVIIQKEGLALILEHREEVSNSKSTIKTEKRDGVIIYSFSFTGDYNWDKALRFNQKDETEKGYWNSFICFNDTARNQLSIAYNEVGFDKKKETDFGVNTIIGTKHIAISKQGNVKVRAVTNLFKKTSLALVLSPKVYSDEKRLFIISEPLDKSSYLLGEVE